MKDAGRFKERYDYSFDSRQLGLVLLGTVMLAALVFVLGVSVGIQWQKKKVVETYAVLPKPVVQPVKAAQPPEPVAPPVLTPVTTTPAQKQATDKPAPQPADQKQTVKPAAKPEQASADLTFPKVLASNAKEPAPLEKKKAKAVPNTSGGKFSIQFGAFSQRSVAESRAEKLRKMGYDAYVYEARGRKGVYTYKVHIGHFTSKDEAAGRLKKLKEVEKGPPPFISKED